MKAAIAGVAKRAGKLLWIEMFVPGGTLIVLAILLAGILTPAFPRKLAALFSAGRKNGEDACLRCDGIDARPVDWLGTEMPDLHPIKRVEYPGVRL